MPLQLCTSLKHLSGSGGHQAAPAGLSAAAIDSPSPHKRPAGTMLRVPAIAACMLLLFGSATAARLPVDGSAAAAASLRPGAAREAPRFPESYSVSAAAVVSCNQHQICHAVPCGVCSSCLPRLPPAPTPLPTPSLSHPAPNASPSSRRSTTPSRCPTPPASSSPPSPTPSPFGGTPRRDASAWTPMAPHKCSSPSRHGAEAAVL